MNYPIESIILTVARPRLIAVQYNGDPSRYEGDASYQGINYRCCGVASGPR